MPRHLGLDLARVCAILGVISIHSFGWIFYRTDWVGSPSWVVGSALTWGSTFCVPLFITLSGALTFSRRALSSGAAAFYRRRLPRILLACGAWHVVYWVFYADIPLGTLVNPGSFLLAAWEGRVAPHLYFLWLILGLYLVAPPLWSLISRLRFGAVFVGVGATLITLVLFNAGSYFFAGFSYPWLIPTYFLPYVGIFVLGSVLAQLRLSLVGTVFSGILALFLMTHSVLVALKVVPSIPVVAGLPYYLGVTTTGIVVCLFVFFSGIREVPARVGAVFSWLSRHTFGVYLVHLLILSAVTWVFPAGSQTLSGAMVVFVVVVLLSWPVAAGLSRIPGVRKIV